MSSPIADTLAEIGAAHDAGHIDQPTAISRIREVMELGDAGAADILRDWKHTVRYMRAEWAPWPAANPANTAKRG